VKTLKSREVIRSIAKEEGVTIQVVEDVIQTHFEFLRHVMSQLADRDIGCFPTARLPNFGSFYVPDNVKARMVEINKKAKENESN
jgi:hypothetical protein